MTAPTRKPLPHEDLTNAIIAGFYYVYNRLGYGFLESVYLAALARYLTKRGLRVAREVLVPVYLDGEIIYYQRLDMVVEDKIIIEGKAGEKIPDHAWPLLLHYLSATPLEVGLLLYFGPKPKVMRRDVPNSAKKALHQP